MQQPAFSNRKPRNGKSRHASHPNCQHVHGSKQPLQMLRQGHEQMHTVQALCNSQQQPQKQCQNRSTAGVATAWATFIAQPVQRFHKHKSSDTAPLLSSQQLGQTSHTHSAVVVKVVIILAATAYYFNGHTAEIMAGSARFLPAGCLHSLTISLNRMCYSSD